MAKTLGYMVTWTVYGTWLQGEKKGYVKDGEIHGENIAIKKDCEKKLEHTPIRLGRREKEIVKEAIIGAAKRFNQKILALGVFSNHVHIVCEYVDIPIGIMTFPPKSVPVVIRVPAC